MILRNIQNNSIYIYVYSKEKFLKIYVFHISYLKIYVFQNSDSCYIYMEELQAIFLYTFL